MAKRLIKVALKRKRKNITNYEFRRKILSGSKPRIVIRKTNRYIIVQFVESEAALDKVKLGLSSKELLKYGYPSKTSIKNKIAAYLTGYLMGMLLNKSQKTNECVVDIGMQKSTAKNRLYSLIKGILDAGIKLAYSEEMLPTIEELQREAKKLGINFETIKSKIMENNS